MIYSPSSHLRCIWLSSLRQIQSELYKKNVLALPSFIMAVNVGWDFEAQKSAFIHHKKCSTWFCGVNKGLLKRSIVLCKKKNPCLKGTLDAKFTFTCCLNKCVLAVCVHNHTIIIKNPPSAFFFKSPQIIRTFSEQAIHRFLAKWRNFDLNAFVGIILHQTAL